MLLLLLLACNDTTTGTKPVCYIDRDGDGYGDVANAIEGCGAGASPSGGDCNDGDATISPVASEVCADGIDNNCDDDVDMIGCTEVDGDGDGATADVDCDDADASRAPGLDEVCDGIDNNCDGTVDEGLAEQTWYEDKDGDGYGDATSTTQNCTQPEGYVDNNTDPDDEDKNNPSGTPEICNNLDDDGDGDVDEDATDALTWYFDSDGDGYGVTDQSVLSCDQPTGYAENSEDCNDLDSTYHPGATEDDCVDSNDYNCDGSTGYTDADADGFAACEDCNDADLFSFPDAAEVCDQADNNCDGEIDNDATDMSAWSEDWDGDGFGAGTPVTACDAPTGWVSQPGDCDDASTSFYPGAPEYCDGLDEDCDGQIDEQAVNSKTWYLDGDGDQIGGSTVTKQSCTESDPWFETGDDCDDTNATVGAPTEWYVDADGDGYGDATTLQLTCTQPTDAVADGSDIDDTDGTSYPGAPERCDNLDNDGDGKIDEDPASIFWYSDFDGDGYGDPATAQNVCNAPTGTVANGDDCDDSMATVYPGATEYCGGIDEDCDGQIDEGAADILTWYFDGDGDGHGRSTVSKQSCTADSSWSRIGDDCDDLDPDVLGPFTWYADADGDEYGDATRSTLDCTQPAGDVSDGTDVDDLDANSYPGASEICDGKDNDGDSRIDENPADVYWYDDNDGDGYGDPTAAQNGCTAPPHTVSNGDDCDDLLTSVSPAGIEKCNTIDDDCDGDIDNNPTDGLPYYKDQDADGYGDPTLLTTACEAPTGYVANTDDCAPTNNNFPVSAYTDGDGDGDGEPTSSHPVCSLSSGEVLTGGDCDDQDSTRSSLTPEICSDNIDNDCDGLTDEDRSTWYRDDDGDGYGDPASSTTACAAPAGFVQDNTDCDDDFATINPGATEICDDEDNNCNGLVDDDDPAISTSSQTIWYPDADLDEYGDGTASGVLACDQPFRYAASGDCDDTNSAIYPDAPEYCDGIANDCNNLSGWVTTDEDGVVSQFFSSGVPEDLTSTLAGVDGIPAKWTMDEDGDLRFCDGTYYVNLTLDTPNVTVSSLNGKDVTILDGGGVGRVIYAEYVSGAMDGLTITGGAGVYFRYAVATMDQMKITGNSASLGGGVAVYYSDLEIVDSEISDNASTASSSVYRAGGGGIWSYYSNLRVIDTQIHDNTAINVGGGILFYSENANELTLTDSLVSYNTANVEGGGAYIETRVVSRSHGTWTCNGSSAVDAGFVGNSATIGGTDGVYLWVGIMTSNACDWTGQGTDLWRNDSGSGKSYIWNTNDKTITCTTGGTGSCL